ncbi:MAG: hypothetical protein DWP98_13880 [Bacteroidetes bacterium]|nr:MAG: hypothetical protein DWP98_13880 [Bacteroidota bacterium]MBL1144165.1 hypothetical protein [Bacteroidota bacterium]MCB0803876.1 polysaccharide deacetylase family protein [Flavobacteriales bacterium]NOG56961.1 hypothetical protein [Bacteroidota bacterium]
MLLIYIPKITPRNRYTIKTVFNHLLQLSEFQLTSDVDRFSEYVGEKLTYAKKPLGDELFIYASGLLEKKGIDEQKIEFGEFDGLITLFANKTKSALPYDIFSAVFYMLSRYEEYLPHRRDHYDRFIAKESLAYKMGFLQTAVVDRWALQLKKVILAKFPNTAFKPRTYSYIPTIDIDNAFAYKEKGLIRTMGGFFKNLMKLNFRQIKDQILVLLDRKSDPYDTYNYQRNIQKKYNLHPIYFILLGDYGFNDKNISYEKRNFQSLIKNLADYAQIGIHPSFGSNQKTENLHKEILRLEEIVKRDITKSRQHFLKLSMPETYRNLVKEDILEDYTMGFANELGFRAGTCSPYPFYDLDEEVECKLTVFPFQVMESTLRYYQNIGITESIRAIKAIIDEVKAVDGTFISLWHNESLGENSDWIGWTKVYEEMIAYALIK